MVNRFQLREKLKINMASAVLQTAEEQITCPICFEVFEEPTALSCLHTFCRSCINNHILEKGRQPTDKHGFFCPMCRRFIPIAANLPIREWVDTLERNHLIATMIQAYKSPRQRLKQPCKTHEDREVEFYCFDHSEYICSICSLKHRRCVDLTSNEEARERMAKGGSGRKSKNSIETEETRIWIDLFFDQCNAIEHAIDKKRSEVTVINTTESEIRNKIIMARKRIYELLSKYEERILLRLTERKSKAVAVIQNDIDQYELIAKTAHTELEALQNLKKSQKKADSKLLEKAMKRYEKNQRQLTRLQGATSAPDKIIFSMNPAIDKFLSDFDSFGTLSDVPKPVKPKETNTSSSDIKKIPKTTTVASKVIGQIQVPVSGGKSTFVTGLTVMPSGQVLMIDLPHEVILLYDSRLQLTSQTKVNPPPYDIISTSGSSNDAMLTSPDAGELRQVFVYPEKVELGQKLQTNIPCRCASFDNGILAVCSNNVLQIYEKDDDVWMELCTQTFDRTTKITYVAVNKGDGKIFITDQQFPDPQILCVSLRGQVLWNLVDERINFATGIAIFGSHVLVASWDNNKVFKITSRGEYVGPVITEGAQFPWRICIIPGTSKLLISQHKKSLSEDQRSSVKVFQINT